MKKSYSKPKKPSNPKKVKDTKSPKNMRGCREPFTVGEDRMFYG